MFIKNIKYCEACSSYSEKNIKYFTDKGLTKNNAKACLYSLLFYTGAGSEYANAATSIEAEKKENLISNLEKYKTKNYSSFIYYLILALNHIDYFWGKCIRWINLNNGENGKYNEYNDYKVGNIVTWIQFSSSSKANSNA